MFTEFDDLGIFNADTEQGTTFINYRKKYEIAGGNDHSLLSVSSSPELGSIVEAYASRDSLLYRPSTLEQAMTTDNSAFNTKLSQYITAYNAYVLVATDNSGSTVAAKANLTTLNTQLIALAQQIVGKMTAEQTVGSANNQQLRDRETNLIALIQELQEQQAKISNINNSYDNDSIEGNIEYTTLNTNSMYYYYIAYFFTGLLMIALIFNMLINPEADTKKGMFLLVALTAVYVISRWKNN
jgi:hypothetical protein